MKESTARPGVMIYFDIRPLMELLSEVQRGQLITGILDYAEDGAEPDYSMDIGLAVAWTQIKPKIDRDEEQYKDKVLKSRYAAYCKIEKAHERMPVLFEEWVISDCGRLTKATDDNGRYPTIATTSVTSTPITSTIESERSTKTLSSAYALGKGECERGNLPSEGWVKGVYKPLPEDQFEKNRENGLAMLSRITTTSQQ